MRGKEGEGTFWRKFAEIGEILSNIRELLELTLLFKRFLFKRIIRRNNCSAISARSVQIATILIIQSSLPSIILRPPHLAILQSRLRDAGR